MSIRHPYYFHPNYRTQSFPYTKVVFGWQHLDLDLKSIVLKCLDLKSLNFKIPCLGLLNKEEFEISFFEYLNLDLDLDLDLRSIKYIF